MNRRGRLAAIEIQRLFRGFMCRTAFGYDLSKLKVQSVIDAERNSRIRYVIMAHL